MKIRLIERHEARVACLRYTGPLGEPLGRFWRNTVLPSLAEYGLLDCPRYGIALDNPMNTPPAQCRYEACVELPPGLSLPDASERLIPAGVYAVTTFKGRDTDIGAAWTAFQTDFHVADLHMGGGRHLDNSRPAFEHYPRGALHDMRRGVFACELCLPVVAP